jgi:SpoVK/Ycf46/Vps4 family AAA+-type ATPase
VGDGFPDRTSAIDILLKHGDPLPPRVLRFEKRIYIPLPDVEARKRMFELNVGTTPCQLTHKDYKELALQTEGYAAS